jgi:tetratricopeptide (TPR) repeat protein
MSSLASSISASSAQTDYSIAHQSYPGSSSSGCCSISLASVFSNKKEKARFLPAFRNMRITDHFLDLEIMAKRLLSSPAEIDSEKLIDPLSKMPKQFKEEINTLNLNKSYVTPVALVLEGPEDDMLALTSVASRFLIASVASTYRIAIRIINRPIKDLICEMSQVVNKNIQLLIFNTHGCSDLMATYIGEYNAEDVCREDFEDLDPYGQIFLLACKTGNNIGRRIAEVSHQIVCAPKKPSCSTDTFILPCNKHHCLEMRTYEDRWKEETQHAIILKDHDAREPCVNLDLERCSEGRQLKYFKNHLINSGDILDLGILLQEKNETQEAMEWYRRGAAFGDSTAMYNLGVLLEKEGKTQEAKECFRSAATLGNITAMNNLGVLLEKEGKTQEAMEWYRRGAAFGDSTAMYNLGVLLEKEGKIQEAKECYQEAADLGNLQAMINLKRLLAKEGFAPKTMLI